MLGYEWNGGLGGVCVWFEGRGDCGFALVMGRGLHC